MFLGGHAAVPKRLCRLQYPSAETPVHLSRTGWCPSFGGCSTIVERGDPAVSGDSLQQGRSNSSAMRGNTSFDAFFPMKMSKCP